MDAMEAVRFRIVGAVLSFSILFLFIGAAARGEEFFTRTDELSCGGTRVQTVATCAAESEDFPVCIDQHFVFFDKTTGTTVRVKASGDPFVDHEYVGKKTIYTTWLWGLARGWACIKGEAGPYIVLEYTKGGTCDTCKWYEVFDENGRKLASDKGAGTDNDIKRFDKTLNSLGLPRPWPRDSFIPIKLLNKDE